MNGPNTDADFDKGDDLAAAKGIAVAVCLSFVFWTAVLYGLLNHYGVL